jgi:hypothetical protein
LTRFFLDPSDNALELKAFADLSSLFAKQAPRRPRRFAYLPVDALLGCARRGQSTRFTGLIRSTRRTRPASSAPVRRSLLPGVFPHPAIASPRFAEFFATYLRIDISNSVFYSRRMRIDLPGKTDTPPRNDRQNGHRLRR